MVGLYPRALRGFVANGGIQRIAFQPFYLNFNLCDVFRDIDEAVAHALALRYYIIVEPAW